MSPKTNYWRDTDSTQVLWRKGEKTLEKGVKRAWNCCEKNLIWQLFAQFNIHFIEREFMWIDNSLNCMLADQSTFESNWKNGDGVC